MTLGFNRIPILTEEENELVFQEILGMKNIWFSRTNWHPAVEIGGEDSGIEDYVHYYTVGAALYMDARDKGWKYYNRLYPKFYTIIFSTCSRNSGNNDSVTSSPAPSLVSGETIVTCLANVSLCNKRPGRKPDQSQSDHGDDRNWKNGNGSSECACV